MVDKSRLIVFDDVFFSFANSGIARVWRSIMLEIDSGDLLKSRNLEIKIINRSNALRELSFEKIDFPEFDFWLPAGGRELLTSITDDLHADLFVSSYYTFALNQPSLLMVYDLIPEIYDFGRQSRGWMERELAFMHAQRYIAISNNTKRDLISYYPFIKDEDVTVAYPGVDHEIFYRRSGHKTMKFKKEYGLGNFIVFVGSRNQEGGYKNGSLFFDALKSGPIADLDVVVVGGEEISERESQICQRNGSKLLRLELSDDELALCLSAAEALIYPSLYEGFGLPPLEALAVGTPIVTTLTSSLPEVTGSLSMVISGNDPLELRERILEVLLPQWKVRIREEGPLWAKKFTWRRMAEAFLDSCIVLLDANQQGNHKDVKDLIHRYTQDVKKIQV